MNKQLLIGWMVYESAIRMGQKCECDIGAILLLVCAESNNPIADVDYKPLVSR